MATDLQSLQREVESRYGLPTGLLSAVSKVESAGNPRARSSAGALGLYQIMPGTASELGIDPLDPAQATEGAGRYLRGLLDQTGDLRTALAAYNWGIGNVKRKGLEEAPAETRAYVPRVMRELDPREHRQRPENPWPAVGRTAAKVGLGLLGSDPNRFAARQAELAAMLGDPAAALGSLGRFPDLRSQSAALERPSRERFNDLLSGLLGIIRYMPAPTWLRGASKVPIGENPTNRELLELFKETEDEILRALSPTSRSPNLPWYMWPNQMAMHEDVARWLGHLERSPEGPLYERTYVTKSGLLD